jgi:hypothetical protein
MRTSMKLTFRLKKTQPEKEVRAISIGQTKRERVYRTNKPLGRPAIFQLLESVRLGVFRKIKVEDPGMSSRRVSYEAE